MIDDDSTVTRKTITNSRRVEIKEEHPTMYPSILINDLNEYDEDIIELDLVRSIKLNFNPNLIYAEILFNCNRKKMAPYTG